MGAGCFQAASKESGFRSAYLNGDYGRHLWGARVTLPVIAGEEK